MKVETTVDISKPPSEVYEFLLEEENLALWIKDFIKLERLEGLSGEVGSKARHIYIEKSKQVSFIEEIKVVKSASLLESELRNEYMNILISNHLHQLEEDRTRLKVISVWTPQTLLHHIKLFFSKKKKIKRQQEDLQRLKDAIEALGVNFE